MSKDSSALLFSQQATFEKPPTGRTSIIKAAGNTAQGLQLMFYLYTRTKQLCVSL